MGCEKRNALYPQYTDHCFTGDYPVKPIDANDENLNQSTISFMSTKTNN